MIKYLKFAAVIACIILSACQKEEGNPVFGDDELYIYENVAETYNLKIGDEFMLEMIVSPNDGSVECVWKLDGLAISTSKNLVYVFVEAGTYQLSFEATRGGRTIKKYFTINVS